MSTQNANVPTGRRLNVLIVAATIALLAIVFMYFRDRQRKRDAQFERLEQRMHLLDEGERPEHNAQPNATGAGGRIL